LTAFADMGISSAALARLYHFSDAQFTATLPAHTTHHAHARVGTRRPTGLPFFHYDLFIPFHMVVAGRQHGAVGAFYGRTPGLQTTVRGTRPCHSLDV